MACKESSIAFLLSANRRELGRPKAFSERRCKSDDSLAFFPVEIEGNQIPPVHSHTRHKRHSVVIKNLSLMFSNSCYAKSLAKKIKEAMATKNNDLACSGELQKTTLSQEAVIFLGHDFSQMLCTIFQLSNLMKANKRHACFSEESVKLLCLKVKNVQRHVAV